MFPAPKKQARKLTRVEMETHLRGVAANENGYQVPPTGFTQRVAYKGYGLDVVNALTATYAPILHFVLDEMIRRGEVTGPLHDRIDFNELNTRDGSPWDKTKRAAFAERLRELVESGDAVPPEPWEDLPEVATTPQLKNGAGATGKVKPPLPKVKKPDVEPEEDNEEQEMAPTTTRVAASKRTAKPTRPAPVQATPDDDEDEVEEQETEVETEDAVDEPADEEETSAGDEEETETEAEDEDEEPTPPPKKAKPATKPAAAAAATSKPKLGTPPAKPGAKPAGTPKLGSPPAKPAAKAATPPPAGDKKEANVKAILEAIGKLDEKIGAQHQALVDENSVLQKRVMRLENLNSVLFRFLVTDSEGQNRMSEEPTDWTAHSTLAAYGLIEGDDAESEEDPS